MSGKKQKITVFLFLVFFLGFCGGILFGYRLWYKSYFLLRESKSAFPGSYPKVVAHAGFSGRYPVNTREGIQRAFELGADGIEVDIQLTKDFVPVLSHDDNLKAKTGQDVNVSDVNLSGLKNYKIIGGYQIPTLEEILIEYSDKFEIIDVDCIHLKIPLEHYCYIADIIKKYNDNSSTILIQFNEYGPLKRKPLFFLKEKYPELKFAWNSLRFGKNNFFSVTDENNFSVNDPMYDTEILNSAGFYTLNTSVRISRSVIDKLKSNNKKVICVSGIRYYGSESSKEFSRLKSINCDYVMVDDIATYNLWKYKDIANNFFDY